MLATVPPLPHTAAVAAAWAVATAAAAAAAATAIPVVLAANPGGRPPDVQGSPPPKSVGPTDQDGLTSIGTETRLKRRGTRQACHLEHLLLRGHRCHLLSVFFDHFVIRHTRPFALDKTSRPDSKHASPPPLLYLGRAAAGAATALFLRFAPPSSLFPLTVGIR